jgi:cell wall-associated NlpC family hydrolase
VFSNNASGWVEASGISTITPEQSNLFQNKEKVFITEDGVTLRDNQNKFIAYSRIGMVLPLLRENNTTVSALYIDGSGNTKELLIPKQSAHIGIQLINKNDLVKIGNQLLKNTYGWGEMFEERDCSSMIRDYMTPFGIWLPRNSAQQAKKGEIVSFKDMNNTQKLTTIKEKGIPFETIIYKKGHVLLYIGTVDDTVLTMHNIWGVRTKDKSGVKGRVIVGRAIVSTLELGSEIENFDPENMLLNTVVSMNIFTRTPSILVQKREDKNSKL